MSNLNNNKRIAKNTALLYIRMLLTMGVSLYTSRVVLNTLGVEDFGIYNVVGGVVAMFSFLNASMSGATSRFLTYELGKENTANLRRVFSSAMTIHLFVALLVIILGETVGLWFLENKLIIPDSRMDAARIVYQCSIFSAVISIVQVPYNASIISHERMNVYAYIEMFNVILKLIIVYLLVLGSIDKLMLYGILLLTTTVIILFIYRLYCKKKFTECSYQFVWDPKLMLPMLSFSGWDLYGNMSVVARTQGVNMLLNIFFGPILNAASGIAGQVQGSVMGLASNMITAVRPQIVKSYACGDYDYMFKLINNAAKYAYLLLYFFSLPLMLEMHFVLKLWLKVVPEYAVSFCIFTLIFNFGATLSMLVISGIHATGKIKRPSIINGSLYLLVIPVTYVLFKLGSSPVIPFLCNVLFVAIGCLSNLWTLKLHVPTYSIKVFMKDVIGVCFLTSLISFIFPFLLKLHFSEGWLRFLLVGAASVLTTTLSIYFIALDRQVQDKFKTKMNIIFKKTLL